MRATRVLLPLALLLTLCGAVSPAQTRSLALACGTIYPDPSAAPIRDGVVLIRDGRIAAVGGRGTVQVPNGTDTIDCTGLTITAGFWNSHVHFTERKWANAARIDAFAIASRRARWPDRASARPAKSWNRRAAFRRISSSTSQAPCT